MGYKKSYEEVNEKIRSGKKVRTAPVASLQKAREIAGLLKKSIEAGKFEITCPVGIFPTGTSIKKLFDTEGGEQ